MYCDRSVTHFPGDTPISLSDGHDDKVRVGELSEDVGCTGEISNVVLKTENAYREEHNSLTTIVVLIGFSLREQVSHPFKISRSDRIFVCIFKWRLLLHQKNI